MGKRFTRRSLLKNVTAIGATSFVASVSAPAEGAGLPQSSVGRQSPDGMAGNAVDLVKLAAGGMVVNFDRLSGTIYSITKEGDRLGTNFLGNAHNTRGVDLGDILWTGNVVSTCWDLKTPDWVREMPAGPGAPYKISGKWRRETTSDSSDTRRVGFDGKTFSVKYQRESRKENGIKSYDLAMRFYFADDNSLMWNIEIANTTGKTLEIGELAFPLRANDDYAEVYKGLTPTQADMQGIMPEMQKLIHEQKVFAHHFIAGHSSYVLLQRPAGDVPFLLFHCANDTSLECSYKVEGSFAPNWIGTDLLAIHSWAAKDLRGWEWNPWVNGHTSLILEPGQVKSFQFRFVFIDGYAAIREELCRSGNLGIRILPSMVVQETPSRVYVHVKSQSDLKNIEIHSDGVTVESNTRADNNTLLTISFKGRGQKSLKLVYGEGRWTNLHFYCIEDAEQLLKARARFIANRQFYENPADPYHRNHMFLPFDYRRGSTFDENDDVWEVGGTDDPGFGEPLFLSAKNVYYPSREEVEKLETYVSDCLFKYIQNPETYEVRASLYWKERYPSSPWGSWSKKRSEATWRTYNYAFVANIYHSLYRIGREYGILTHRTAREYLKMSYHTCMKWFTTGPYKHVGLITGACALNILEDIKSEGWQEEYENLLEEMRKCNEEFLSDPYPYSSEIEIDETAQPQAYFFTRFFGMRGNEESRKRNLEMLPLLKALRGGDQPVWFRYGNDLFAHPDLRGEITCWHSEALNGMALLQGFEDTRDKEMFIKGYAGVMSVMHNVLPDGMGFAWFMVKPGVFACEPPKTFEFGPALWGYLKAAKSYVLDDEGFGLMGCGCEIETSPNKIKVYPRDGVKKRVLFVSERIDIEATTGEIKSLTFDKTKPSFEFQMNDSTGLVKNVQLAIKGLPKGDYRVTHGGSVERLAASDTLELAVPITEASLLTVEKL
jgi:hypothetical protein